jgi:hypothetical protein
MYPGRKDKQALQLKQPVVSGLSSPQRTFLTQTQRYFLGKAGPVLALGLVLGGCTGAPYVDSRREAGQREPVGASTSDLVAICYSSQSATPEEIYQLAESECAKTGRAPELADQTDWSCTLFAPTRIFYRCVAKPLKP